MANERLLIVGDSFFSYNHNCNSWHNRLAKHYNVTNLSCNGVGQYKIHKQLTKTDYNNYDKIIVGVTSPYRIHTDNNPWYNKIHHSHADADLLYEDVKSKDESAEKQHVLWYFENVLDLEYYDYIHRLTVEHMQQTLQDKLHMMITFFDMNIPNVLNLHNVWKNNQGETNHMNNHAHKKVYQQVIQYFG